VDGAGAPARRARLERLGHPAHGVLAGTGPIAAAPPFGGWSRSAPAAIGPTAAPGGGSDGRPARRAPAAMVPARGHARCRPPALITGGGVGGLHQVCSRGGSDGLTSIGSQLSGLFPTNPAARCPTSAPRCASLLRIQHKPEIPRCPTRTSPPEGAGRPVTHPHFPAQAGRRSGLGCRSNGNRRIGPHRNQPLLVRLR